MARPKTITFDNEYHKLKQRRYYANPRNIKYYVVEINGIQHAFTGPNLRKNRIKGKNLKPNCVIFN